MALSWWQRTWPRHTASCSTDAVACVITHKSGTRLNSGGSAMGRRIVSTIALTTLLLALLGGAAQTAFGAETSSSARVPLGNGVFLQRADANADGPGPLPRDPGVERIVGGTATTIQQWPWQVAITLSPAAYSGNAFERQWCGGSLVAPQIVITAAHCFYEESSGWQAASDFAAVSGRTRLSSSSEGMESLVDTYWNFTDSAGNDLYDPETDEWDVVVVRLEQASPSATIKLASATEAGLWAAGRTAFATGWGATSTDGPSSDVLRVVSLSIMADSTCQSRWQMFAPSVMLCAAAPGRDTCQGDSGGPLVVGAAGGQYRLVGDTSFGGPCADPYLPGVYGRLSADPMRATLRQAVLDIAGVDIVAAGTPPPPPPPPGLTLKQAENASWAYSKRACQKVRKCRKYWAGDCKAAGSGFNCEVRNYLRKKKRRSKATCVQGLTWAAGANGAPELAGSSNWRCVKGWQRSAFSRGI